MTTSTQLSPGSVVLASPIGGLLRWYPPRVPCGELAVFQAHETIASVSNQDRTERLEAPGLGFLLREFVHDGAQVEAGTQIAVFSLVKG